MLLATVFYDCRCQLEADLQEYYGIDISNMGSSVSVTHIACLVAQLPFDSRVITYLNGINIRTSTNTVIIRDMVNELRDFHVDFVNSKSKRKQKKPKPYQIPGMDVKKNKRSHGDEYAKLTIDELERILNGN